MRSTSSWRATSSDLALSSKASRCFSSSVSPSAPLPLGTTGAPATASRASAATRRASPTSGIFASRARASSASPRPTRISARATTALGRSGSSSSAWRSEASSPAATSCSASLGAGSNRSTNSRTAASGSAPMKRSTIFRSLIANTAGIDCVWKLCAIIGLSSTLTLTSSTAPPVASTTRSIIGLSALQGPHHGAHRSTMTGTVSERTRTSFSKEASVVSIVIAARPYRLVARACRSAMSVRLPRDTRTGCRRRPWRPCPPEATEASSGWPAT